MPKAEELFYIREIAAACGVSINALRFYEAKGLLKPAYTSPDSGYRYYSRENLHRLRTMLRLKDAGLSLEEIKAYMDGDMDVGTKIAELEERRELICRAIEDLKIRQTTTEDLTVSEITLPERLCLCRTIHARDGEHALLEIGNFYSELIQGGVRMSKACSEFCEYPDDSLLHGKFPVTDFDVTACVPVDKKSAPREAVRYPSGDAISVNYRGGYFGLREAYVALNRYIEEHGCVLSGHPQEIYVEIDAEGTVHLDESQNITRVIIPVKLMNG